LSTNSVAPLRIALIVIGVTFIIGVYPLTVLWPSGWAWHLSGPSMYLQMILGVYATLGVFLLLAARNPLGNLSLIWFTAWSSIVHGLIMLEQALVYPQHHGHLLGDVPALILIGLILGFLAHRAAKAGA
jgi:Family of unknown function (DUF6632)